MGLQRYWLSLMRAEGHDTEDTDTNLKKTDFTSKLCCLSSCQVAEFPFGHTNDFQTLPHIYNKHTELREGQPATRVRNGTEPFHHAAMLS